MNKKSLKNVKVRVGGKKILEKGGENMKKRVF